MECGNLQRGPPEQTHGTPGWRTARLWVLECDTQALGDEIHFCLSSLENAKLKLLFFFFRHLQAIILH